MVMETMAQRPSVVARAAPAPSRRRRNRPRRGLRANAALSLVWLGLKAAPLFFKIGADPKSPDFYPRNSAHAFA
jgi:hypothetical protein